MGTVRECRTTSRPPGPEPSRPEVIASRPALPAAPLSLTDRVLGTASKAPGLWCRAPRDDKLDAYVKEVVDSLPPLTEAQRDLRALIFRNRHR
jgi:hypothetical protein